MGFQISLCQFHKNSLSERPLEGKAVTLWDELTEQKAVSQKASFQFLTADISFFTIALYGLPNITLQIPQDEPYRKASWEESCNLVRCIHITHGSFSGSFFPVFKGIYFLFHRNPLWDLTYHFQNSTRQSERKASSGKCCNTVEQLTEHKADSQKASFHFWTKDTSFFTVAL